MSCHYPVYLLFDTQIMKTPQLPLEIFECVLLDIVLLTLKT